MNRGTLLLGGIFTFKQALIASIFCLVFPCLGSRTNAGQVGDRH